MNPKKVELFSKTLQATDDKSRRLGAFTLSNDSEQKGQRGFKRDSKWEFAYIAIMYLYPYRPTGFVLLHGDYDA